MKHSSTPSTPSTPTADPRKLDRTRERFLLARAQLAAGRTVSPGRPSASATRG